MIALIFSESGLIPDVPTAWPKNLFLLHGLSDVLANWHFLSFRVIPTV